MSINEKIKIGYGHVSEILCLIRKKQTTELHCQHRPRVTESQITEFICIFIFNSFFKFSPKQICIVIHKIFYLMA